MCHDVVLYEGHYLIWSIACVVFYTVSQIFQPYNCGDFNKKWSVIKCKRFSVCHHMSTVRNPGKHQVNPFE